MTRSRYVLVASNHHQCRIWEAAHHEVNTRDVIRVVTHASLQRIRGRKLSDPEWKVILLGTPDHNVPWHEYLEVAGWGRDVLVKMVNRKVGLPPALDAELQLEAERDERPVDVVIRLAIREYLQLERRSVPSRGHRCRPSMTGSGSFCEEVHPDETAFDVCAAIVPESVDRLMYFSEARTVIDTLEARKANRNGNS